MSSHKPNRNLNDSVEDKREQLIDVLLYGLAAGYLFRYGILLQSEDNDWGVPASVVGIVIGIIFVFPIKPFWRSVVVVAAGIGLADIATILFD